MNENEEMNNLRKHIKVLLKHDFKTSFEKKVSNQNSSDLFSKITGFVTFSKELARRRNCHLFPINDLTDGKGMKYSLIEQEERCQLAIIYRLMDLYGWTLNIFNHNTMRSNENGDEFLINPFGPLFREITASSFVKINLQGETVDPGSSIFGINKTGWVIHSAIYAFRPDITCIIHSHIPEVIAVSCLTYGLLPTCDDAAELIDESFDSISGGVTYHDYWGLALNEDECQSLRDDLGPRSKVMLLRNHGVLVCGSNYIEAWNLLKKVVNACENQVHMTQTKGENYLLKSYMLICTNLSTNNGSTNKKLSKSSQMENEILDFDKLMLMLDSHGYQTGYSYTNISNNQNSNLNNMDMNGNASNRLPTTN